MSSTTFESATAIVGFSSLNGSAFSTPTKPISRESSRDNILVLSPTPPTHLKNPSTSDGMSDLGKNVIIIPRAGGSYTTTTTTTTSTKDTSVASPMISSPLKTAGRRGKSMSRDTSKETIQSYGSLHDALAPASHSHTTTSFFPHPHPPGSVNSQSPVVSNSPSRAIISTTTTSITHVDDSTLTKLPSVSAPVTAASLTATLLAATKESNAQQLSLPSIVSAHQSRIAQLEATTVQQGESIIELQKMIHLLQKQLVMVMANQASTSGTGGLSASSLTGTASAFSSPQQPGRSRSSTELRMAQAAARAVKRSSGTSTPRSNDEPSTYNTPRLHHGSTTSSLENLHAKKTSRPGSQSNSRYSSPRHSAPMGKGTSHHFSFHPQTIATQPPPGQIHVDHTVPITNNGPKTPRTNNARSRARLLISNPQALQHAESASNVSSPVLKSNPLISRRLTPVEAMKDAGMSFDSSSSSFTSVPPSNYPAQAAYPFQPMGSPASDSSYHASPNAPQIQSLDTLRPIPINHTVTHGKHGVTEYVLSFRDDETGEVMHDGANGHFEFPEEHGNGTVEKKEKKKKKKEKDRDSKDRPEMFNQATGDWMAMSPPKRPGSTRRMASSDNMTDASPEAAEAMMQAVAANKKEKEKEGKKSKSGKTCKVAGCGEPRIGVEKYCKAHAGPAPLNPNARKMMFAH